jgi:hypothetical protein
MRSPNTDDLLIGILARSYDELIFFPQGSEDVEYAKSLPAYKKCQQKITIAERNMSAFVSSLKQSGCDYIGTRLHAGIKALQLGNNALILSVDNRAKEIARDTGLPVVSREEIDLVRHWIGGECLFHKIRVPVEEILAWKAQFQPSLI